MVQCSSENRVAFPDLSRHMLSGHGRFIHSRNPGDDDCIHWNLLTGFDEDPVSHGNPLDGNDFLIVVAGQEGRVLRRDADQGLDRSASRFGGRLLDQAAEGHDETDHRGG